MLLIALLSSPVIGSEIPDPEYCQVVPCDATGTVLISPFHMGDGPDVTHFTVTVRSEPDVPVPNAYIEILFAHPDELLLCDPDRLSGYADAGGRIQFSIPGGGCSLHNDAVSIRANDTVIRLYGHVTSPDYDGQPDGAVTLTDFTTFSAALVSSIGGCTDYFNDGTTGLDDFIAFGECWGGSCP